MSVEPDNIIQNANDSGISSDGERSVSSQRCDQFW